MVLENIHNMINLSMEKKRYLEELLDLATIQEEIIIKEQVDELEKLLSRKDKLMETIDDIDKNFLSFYDNVKKQEDVKSFEYLDVTKYPNLQNLKDIIKDINNILNTIDIKEKNNINKMKENVEKTKADLKQIKEVKRAYKGYNYEEAGSILIDENR